jgi:hypothetical protein
MKAILSCAAVAIAVLAVAGLKAGEPTCNAEPSCTAPAGCNAGACCPKCGCHEGLIPVCHPYCATKKVVKYHYCCKCEELCVPGRFPCCPKCGDGCCDQAGCTGNCASDNCGGEQGKCNCLYRDVHKMVKIPYTVEVPVRKCTIEWICPKCKCCCGTTEVPAAASAPMPPSPPVPGKSASASPMIPTSASY